MLKQADQFVKREFTKAQFAELAKQINEEKNPKKRNELIENLQLLMDYVAVPDYLNQEDKKVLEKIVLSTIASMTISSDPQKREDAAKFANFLNQETMGTQFLKSDIENGCISPVTVAEPRFNNASTTALTFLALVSDLYAPKDFSPQPDLPAGGITMNREEFGELDKQNHEFMQKL